MDQRNFILQKLRDTVSLMQEHDTDDDADLPLYNGYLLMASKLAVIFTALD